MTYEDLAMDEVEQAIDLTQHYDGEGHSTYAFVDIAFRRFRVYGGGGDSAAAARKDYDDGSGHAASSQQGPPTVVVFDCDDSLQGGANCEVEMEDLEFTGYGKDGARMSCAGVRGDAKELSGITSCL